MKQFRMLIIGLIAGVMLTISATAFAAGGISKIEAYLREGFTFKVNGQAATLQNTPIVYNDTSYMPVRELAGMLGYDVGFEDNTITLDAKMSDETIQTQGVEDMSETVVTEEWLSLRQIAERGIEVKVGPEHNVLTIQNGDHSIRFLTTDIATDHTTDVILHDSSGTVTVRSEGGQTYLRVDQLQANGIID